MEWYQEPTHIEKNNDRKMIEIINKKEESLNTDGLKYFMDDQLNNQSPDKKEEEKITGIELNGRSKSLPKLQASQSSPAAQQADEQLAIEK